MVSTEQLQAFIPFQSLDEHQLILLASNSRLLSVNKGVKLFINGDIDSNEYFLLKGCVELRSGDGFSQVINAQDEKAKRQLSRLRPRQFDCITSESSDLIVIEADIIEDMQEDSRRAADQEENYGVSEADTIEELEQQEILADFAKDLRNNKFILPSLPEVAIKVRRLIEDEQASAHTVAAVINTDPAIAAKLIRAANSPIYHGASKCDTTPNAIVRLGLETTRKLVVSFSLKDVFKGSPELKPYFHSAWQHSVEVSSIAMVLGRMMKLPDLLPDELMLAGLLHDIGVIAALAFVGNRADLISSEAKILSTIDLLRGPAGEAVLKQWHFPDDFIEAAKYAKDWRRSHPMKADVCDVVQIAKLHSYLRHHKKIKDLPRIDTIPAFSKLPLGDVTPELTLRILDESNDQIKEAQKLLN